MNIDIIKLDEVDSTNLYVEKLVYENHLIKDTVVIANAQKNGRGQHDKFFYSPKGNGLYFSILHFYEDILDIEDITLKVGVCISNVLKNNYDKNVKIKLINDIYLDNKKVVGILCKHIIAKKALIIGVGIDLYKNENVPKELQDIVGYIFDKKINEDELIERIIDKIYNNFYKRVS